MHVQLSFLEEKVEAGVEAGWSPLDKEQRVVAVATPARLLAKLAGADHVEAVPENDE